MDMPPFLIDLKKIKYLRINLTSEVKDPYNENFRRWRNGSVVKTTCCSWRDLEFSENFKLTERDFRELKDTPCSWTCGINIDKMTILSKRYLQIQYNIN